MPSPGPHSAPLSLAEAQTLRSGELQQRAGDRSVQVLRNADLAMTLTYQGDDIKQISAARLTPKGEEVLALSLDFSQASSPANISALLAQARIKAGSVLSYDQALASLEKLARQTGAELRYSIAELGYEALSPSRVKIDASTEKDPLATRDTLTGLRGKAALLSARGLAELSTEIAGPRTLVFLDFNNMGVANKFRLGAEVDSILTQIKDAANRSFSGLNAELFRVGGDEFALVVQQTRATPQAIERFRHEIAGITKTAFAPNSAQLSKAEDFATLRARTRLLFAEYLKAKPPSSDLPFTLRDFRLWLGKQISPTFLPDRTSTGELAIKVARAKLAAEPHFRSTGVMSFSCAAVELGNSLTPDTLQRALGAADKAIHEQKEGKRDPASTAVISAAELNSINIRAASQEAAAAATSAARRFSISEADLALLKTEQSAAESALVRARAATALKIAAGVDPTVGENVLRYNLVMNERVSDYRTLGSGIWHSAFVFDVNHFGVINNQLGYDRGDALISHIAGAIRDHYPDALIVRKDGGRLVVFTDYGFDRDKLQAIWLRAEKALEEAVHTEKALAEYQMRVALEALSDSGPRLRKPMAIKTMSLEAAAVERLGESTFAELIAQVESNKSSLRRADLAA